MRKTAKKAAPKKAAAKSKKSAPKKTAPKKVAKTKNASKAQNNPEDIVHLILQDHITLKECIEVMKDDEASLAEKREAFEIFAPALISHAKPEEQTWYVNMKEVDDMEVEGLEGDIEHMLADQLCEELKRTDDDNMFIAKAKVLAELLEHHIEEEEEEMLPEFKKNSTMEERVELGVKYLQLQGELNAQGDEDSPREANLRSRKKGEAHPPRH